MLSHTLTRTNALLAWGAAMLLCGAPLLMAADSGGVLPWTQWAATVYCLAALALAAPTCLSSASSGNWQQHTIALLLLAVAAYGFLQSAPLPTAAIAALAPGSQEAYSLWLSPLSGIPEDAELLRNTPPRLSVDTTLTRSAAWLSALVAGYAVLASHLFVDRSRLRWLLIALAITGALHAGLGLYQLATRPEATVWGLQSQYGGKPFGAFINRSNAAVMLNLGLAASLGVIAWRLAALTGVPLTAERFPFNELLDVAFDRLSIIAFTTASFALVGLLCCGSRSGLIGTIGGLMLALGMVQSVTKLRGFLATAIGLGLIVAILLINLDLSVLSADRVSRTAEEVIETTEFKEARFAHWRDGFAAALHQPITGWGWGAYRYAYLPFQKTSSGAWFVNADNLWLELFVETGLVGLMLLGIGIFTILRSLSRLSQSADPLDHGLVTAGWFAVGTLMISQLFDFGLRIPANSIMAAVLLSAVTARHYSSALHHEGIRPSAAQHRVQLERVAASTVGSGRHGWRFVSPMLLLACLLTLIAAAAAFSWQARGDKAIRASRILTFKTPADLDAAEGIAESLATYLAARPFDATALRTLAHLEMELARIKSIENTSDPTQLRLVSQSPQLFSRSNLRKRWYHQVGQSTSAADSAQEPSQLEVGQPWLDPGPLGRQARTHAVKSILASPLSPEAKLTAVAFDFSGGEAAQSAELLQQVATLRKQNPDTLLYVGDLAAEAGDWDLVARTWQRVLHLNPRATAKILRRLPPDSPLQPNDVVPASVAALRAAAAIELRKTTPDGVLLLRALQTLQTVQQEQVAARLHDLQLISNILHKLNRFDEQSATLQHALRVNPRDADLRFEYASALLRAGKPNEAREEARTGRQLAPEDARFDRLIQSIAGATTEP